MSRVDGEDQDDLPAEIRRQARSAASARYFRALPAFRADVDLPPEFRKLLGDLDRAERRAARSRAS